MPLYCNVVSIGLFIDDKSTTNSFSMVGDSVDVVVVVVVETALFRLFFSFSSAVVLEVVFLRLLIDKRLFLLVWRSLMGQEDRLLQGPVE